MLIPLIGIAQKPSSLTLNGHLASDAEDKMLLLKNMKDAIKFQNIHRSYFEYKPLVFDQKLTDDAQQWADYLAVINNPEHSTVKDGKGELIFYAPTNYFKESSNLLIKASVCLPLFSTTGSSYISTVFSISFGKVLLCFLRFPRNVPLFPINPEMDGFHLCTI